MLEVVLHSPMDWMQLALDEASAAGLECAPNPRVGCVLVNPAGSVIGRGRTQQVGGAHAEVMALRDAKDRGESTVNATAYVTLEPCAHQGRTGPCCDALIAAGVGRVVASIVDPNPRVSGEGFRRLRAAGIEVVEGPGAAQTQALNPGFFKRMRTGLPWVRAKVAVSLDGFTALTNGASKWITSQEARDDGHQWRAKANAILTGIGTVLSDDPELNVRTPGMMRQPKLAIVDTHLRTPPNAKVFNTSRDVHIFAASPDLERRNRLTEKGGLINAAAADYTAPSPTIDLRLVLIELGKMDINEVHVEAGAKIIGSLHVAGLVDEYLIYIAPKLLGSGVNMLCLPPIKEISQSAVLRFLEVRMIGRDIRIIAQPSGS